MYGGRRESEWMSVETGEEERWREGLEREEGIGRERERESEVERERENESER